MQLSFTSSPADHMYFEEVRMNVTGGIKIEFYENGKHIATLIDYNFQAIALWKGSVEFISRVDPLIKETPYNFKLTNKEETPFAWGEVDNNCTVIFPDYHSSYEMIPRTHRFSKEEYRNSYEFVMHKKVCCLVKYGEISKEDGWFRRNFLPVESSSGVIEMKDNLSSGHLFGFMLMVSRYWVWPGDTYRRRKTDYYPWE